MRQALYHRRVGAHTRPGNGGALHRGDGDDHLLYQAFNAVCEEPVLRDFTWRIRTDEVQHYKHFYRYFLRYREQEHLH